MDNADSSWSGRLSTLIEPSAPGAATKPIRKLPGQFRYNPPGINYHPPGRCVAPRAHDLPSLSASAITFKGYATIARKEDAARRTRQGNGQNGECSLHLGRRAVEKATGSLDRALDIINEETIERERLRRLVNRPPLVLLLGAPGGS
jgi:hypothetical protein